MCANHLMARPFHLFPSCGHKFHTDCLTEAVKPHLSLARQRRLEELLQDLASRKNENDDVQSIDSKQEPMNQRTVTGPHWSFYQNYCHSTHHQSILEFECTFLHLDFFSFKTAKKSSFFQLFENQIESIIKFLMHFFEVFSTF